MAPAALVQNEVPAQQVSTSVYQMYVFLPPPQYVLQISVHPQTWCISWAFRKHLILRESLSWEKTWPPKLAHAGNVINTQLIDCWNISWNLASPCQACSLMGERFRDMTTFGCCLSPSLLPPPESAVSNWWKDRCCYFLGTFYPTMLQACSLLIKDQMAENANCLWEESHNLHLVEYNLYNLIINITWI